MKHKHCGSAESSRTAHSLETKTTCSTVNRGRGLVSIAWILYPWSSRSTRNNSMQLLSLLHKLCIKIVFSPSISLSFFTVTFKPFMLQGCFILNLAQFLLVVSFSCVHWNPKRAPHQDHTACTSQTPSVPALQAMVHPHISGLSKKLFQREDKTQLNTRSLRNLYFCLKCTDWFSSRYHCHQWMLRPEAMKVAFNTYT